MIDTKALREKVLDLAIRGKLVPQDPTDEPASVLLERIREQKKQMVKEGKLKAKDIKDDSVIFVGDDNLHYEKFADGTVECIEDEIPFELPSGWSWVRFGTLTINRDSERKPVALSSRKNVEKKYDYYGASGKIDKIDNYLFDEKLLLIGEDGANLVTRSKPIAFFAEGQYWVNNHAHCIDATDKRYLNYLCYFINAINLEPYVTGSAQPKMNQENMNNILISLPPFKEQLQILNQIDLFYEAISSLENEQQGLVDLIGMTKSKILDFAIRGKLVPQDPDDEPASVLLERIRTQKEELIKQDKIKRDKKESVIFKGEDNSYYRLTADKKRFDAEIPFEIPKNWCWTTLPSVASVELGKTLDKAKNTGSYHPYLRSVNVQWGYIDLSDLNEMKFEEHEIDKYSIKRNDLLICEGGDVGRCCIWEINDTFLYQNALHRVRFYADLEPRFYLYVMMLYESLGILKNISTGVTIKHLTGNVLSAMPVPLPPLSEQKRIVEAIEVVFAQLDEITSSIS